MAGEAGEGEDAPLMNGSEDTVVMSQLHGESAKEEHTGRGKFVHYCQSLSCSIKHFRHDLRFPLTK